MNIYFKPTRWKTLIAIIILMIYLYTQKMLVLLSLISSEYEILTKPHCTLYLSPASDLFAFIESIKEFYQSFLLGRLSFLLGGYDVCYSTDMSQEINLAQILFYCTVLAAAYILSCTVAALYRTLRKPKKNK